ncbi:UHRF1-binding protein 1,UHRF1-binding protein 1-like [Lepeophtheirus salmonis]|uniref:UHRF1-binding protein 1,UHRF1-binding protein 1-like n=1 Tax=Lepeophtheirus salmonis TaxID=72036 RepID=A0A7R8D1J4_LEPSM|nr:UHRF1-binding protein 1,UHRF1-binding protein 1-like [Lepeophtheirus salmonis]CAF2969250.1 UHRF1-binding protein 1,UHRF1-binding protein 1-like [Lepeophtheirus salmonis]
MTSLLKNQILKHLSKFAKNLSPDQVNLSALKGEGELKNLELNEEVLTDLLELPSWLKLTEATCNRVTVRIQWTKLKSVPIHLSLDEVRVQVQTCEELRRSQGGNSTTQHLSHSATGPYGFADKVVDGMTLTVNSVILTLNSKVFQASFNISRIMVESKSPQWNKADLRSTRLKDALKKELLIFKELSWTTIKIEAKSTVNEELTPLRLITNLAKCRITIKKRLSDCSVLGCRLVLILDDLLWVLTDDQLQAALHFADSISGLIKRATEETQKAKGARKLENLSGSCEKVFKEKTSKRKTADNSFTCQHFAAHDVIETSYHIYLGQIDLHLCDDPGGNGRSSHPSLKDGGAFQITLSKLQVDFYPETLSSSQYHRHISKSVGDEDNEHSVHHNILSKYDKLMTANLIIRLSNFSFWKVTTSKGKIIPKEFIKSDDARCSFKDEMPVLHLEYSQFYYPGDDDFSTNLSNHCLRKVLSHLILDVKIEAILLKIIYEDLQEYSDQPERPRSLEIQVSRVLAANYRSSETGTISELNKTLKIFSSSDLFNSFKFPNEESDLNVICQKFYEVSNDTDLKTITANLYSGGIFRKDLLWNRSKDVWYVTLDPLWADFKGRYTTPLVNAFPVTLWLYKEPKELPNDSKEAKMHIIAQVHKLVTLQLNHYQLLLFLQRMSETLSEITIFLTHDLMRILGEDDQGSMCLGVDIPQADVSFLIKSLNEHDRMKRNDSSSIQSILSVEKSQSPIIDPLTQGNSTNNVSLNSTLLNSATITDTLSDSIKSSSKLMSSASKKMVNGQLKARSKLTHSLTNIKASLDSSFRGSTAQLSLRGEDDTLSIRSEGSSDSESFIVNNQHQGCEKEYDVKISIATFHLEGIELANQSNGPPPFEFQEKFNSASKDWNLKEKSNKDSWCTKLRFTSNSPTDISNILELSPDVTLTDKIRHYLFEDEIIPVPIPMNINIDNVSFHLSDDQPPNNSTSPGTVPVDLNISSLSIARDKTGVFSITSSNNNNNNNDSGAIATSLNSNETRRATLLEVANDNLRASLSLCQFEVLSLKAKLQEQEIRNKRYSETLKKVTILEKENESMKLTLQYLQQELIKSGEKAISFFHLSFILNSH